MPGLLWAQALSQTPESISQHLGRERRGGAAWAAPDLGWMERQPKNRNPTPSLSVRGPF